MRAPAVREAFSDTAAHEPHQSHQKGFRSANSVYSVCSVGPATAATIKVTVAIPTYNRADFLRQTLAGIAAQQFPREHFEVLVIDNNSTDHTAAVVAEFANERPAPRYLREEKQGLDHARNRALAEARGEIVVFGDDDILVKPDWLAQMAVPLIADAARK